LTLKLSPLLVIRQRRPKAVLGRVWPIDRELVGGQKKVVFPDKSMKSGAVMHFLDLKAPRLLDWTSQPRQGLKGWVRIMRANSRQPVVGEFDFVSEEAISLKGRFEAQWINKGRLEKAVQRDAPASR
jgi:hypothetical protein